MNKLGFIGMGNMAQALAVSFIRSGKIKPENVFAYAPHQDKLRRNAELIGFTPVSSVTALADAADTIVFACKPYQIESVLQELGTHLDHKAVVSVALGWDYEKFTAAVSESVRIQYVMPNTPAMVGEGVMLFEDQNSFEEKERNELLDLFSVCGTVQEMPSRLMGIAGTITGCGPAFVDMIIEAYADAGVKYGLQRTDAYKLVSQMILGSAKLQRDTGTHPAVLKDNVCSPNGATIRGVASLEESGLRSACIRSIDEIMNRK